MARRRAPSPLRGDRPTKYAEAVAAGKIVAGPYVRLACQRHLDDLARWGTAPKKAPFYYDARAAARVIAFFERELVLCDLEDGDSDVGPFLLTDWQAFIAGSLFGWKKRTGHRRFRTAYIETGKGSGKTPFAAGLGLYLLVADGKRYAEVYSAATSQEQAAYVWKYAERMVQHAPRLRKHIAVGASVLRSKRLGGIFKAVSSEKRSLQGKKVHGAILEELHEHPNRDVTASMRRGVKGNKNALIIEITNAGNDRTSICYEHHEYSVRIIERVVSNEEWFCYVCALDEGDDWRDRACWPKANPNIGISIPYEYLASAVTEAEGMPAAEAEVRQLNFCEWVDRQLSYVTAAAWQACQRVHPPPGLERLTPLGALDLGQTDDMSSFCLVWRLEEDRYFARWWYWVPAAALKNKALSHRPWGAWRATSQLTVHPGEVTDYPKVRVAISQIARAAGCRTIAYDKRFAVQLAQELEGEAFEMLDVPQGFYLNEATRKLGALIKHGAFEHEGDPITAWQMSNLVVVKGTRGDIRPAKEKASDKIDGAVAAIMALGRAMLPNAPPPAPRVYRLT